MSKYNDLNDMNRVVTLTKCVEANGMQSVSSCMFYMVVCICTHICTHVLSVCLLICYIICGVEKHK